MELPAGDVILDEEDNDESVGVDGGRSLDSDASASRMSHSLWLSHTKRPFNKNADADPTGIVFDSERSTQKSLEHALQKLCGGILLGLHKEPHSEKGRTS